MCDWDVQRLVEEYDSDELALSISDQTTRELVNTYVSLQSSIACCLAQEDIPYAAGMLSGLSYAYGIELVNRFLYRRDLSVFDTLPELPMPDYLAKQTV